MRDFTREYGPEHGLRDLCPLRWPATASSGARGARDGIQFRFTSAQRKNQNSYQHNWKLKGLSLIPLILLTSYGLAQEIEWVKYQDPRSGKTVTALFCHPQPGQKLPAVVYNHGKIIEMVGYQGGIKKGYDVADFVKALSGSGYVAIAPIRPSNTEFNFAPFLRGTMHYLQQRSDIDVNRLGMIGFSKGGYMTLEAASHFTDLKAVVAMSPARPDKPLSEDQLNNIHAPLLVTLGREEKNDPIGQVTESAVVGVMKKLGKKIEYQNNYPGDHQWFYKVRNEFWRDVIEFLDKHLKKDAK
ncbi:MAG: dienelactone hydrolase family protein [Verrucomicrobia bacterium]|nr:dienelactone hydrolase family protein [Verrucomicrobiota bacterium]